MTPATQARTGDAARSSRFSGTSLGGEASKAALLKFPPRPVLATWPATTDSCERILERLKHPPLRTEAENTQYVRRRGASLILRWLESFPGDTWQQRWYSTSAHNLGRRWLQEPLTWGTEHGEPGSIREQDARSGLLILLCADVIRPDLEWLSLVGRSRHWREAAAAHRDPDGFARLEAAAGPDMWSAKRAALARNQIATLLFAKGGGVLDITVGDCLELREVETRTRAMRGGGRSLFYSMLKDQGIFPPDAPGTLRGIAQHAGQVSVEQLVDRYALRCKPVRDLIVDYLKERQPVLDYTSLEDLSRNLARNFWKDLETHNEAIDSLHLARDVAAKWKERIRTRTVPQRMPDGSTVEITKPRLNIDDLLMAVRAFYLDIAQWAAEDPARWGRWVAPCPVSASDYSTRKSRLRRKARMDQRTRERLPALPALVQAAEERLEKARIRLEALRATRPGASFEILGETYTKPVTTERDDPTGSGCAFDASGRRRNFMQDEHRSFWGWAAIEVLRATGIRIEEMLEISHHSITQYTLPDTGELIPLLHIAPSKTDQERLLPID